MKVTVSLSLCVFGVLMVFLAVILIVRSFSDQEIILEAEKMNYSWGGLNIKTDKALYRVNPRIPKGWRIARVDISPSRERVMFVVETLLFDPVEGPYQVFYIWETKSHQYKQVLEHRGYVLAYWTGREEIAISCSHRSMYCYS